MARNSDQEIFKLANDFQKRVGIRTEKAILADENGRIFEPGQPGYVRVRRIVAGGFSEYITVRLAIVINPIPGTGVRLGYDADNQLAVIGLDFASLEAQGTNSQSSNPADPNNTYFVNQQRLTTFVCHPVSTAANSMLVAVQSGDVIDLSSDTLTLFPGSQEDLTTFIPGGAGEFCVACLFWKDDNTIEIFASTPKTSPTDLGIDDINECFAARTAGSLPIWSWQLYNGQTGIAAGSPADGGDDFMDLRPLFFMLQSGGGGGMTDFLAAGDTGTPQTIANGNTLSILGGTGLSSVASATDTVTVNLDNTAVTPASYTNTALTVDAQGRITAASSGAAPVTSVSGTAPIASSGGATPAISLNDTAVTPGSYTYGGFTVDQKGRLTAASSGAAPVTSVALTAAPTGIFDVSGSPVTGSGTLALSMDNQNANIVLAGPASGGAATPSFRALVDDDIPAALTLVAGTINNTPIGATTANTAIVSALSLLISTFKGIFTHANTADRTYTYQDVSFTVGRDSFILAKNVTGGTVTAGQLVYFSGASSIQNAQIAGLAIANSTRDHLAQGVVRTASIANNAFGLVQIGGVFTGMVGGAYGIQYLSDSSSGNMTNTPPTGTSYVQIVGIQSSSLANGDFTLLFQAPYPNNIDAAAITSGTFNASIIGSGTLDAARLPTTVSSLIFTSTANASVTGTGAVSLIGSGVGSLTIPANRLVAGTSIVIKIKGIWTTDATPGNTTILAKLGSTTICTTIAAALSPSISNLEFTLEVVITCRTAGATGTVRGQGEAFLLVSASASNFYAMPSTADVTIDTTATQAIDVTWNNSNSGNTITGTNCVIELKG